MYSTRPPAPGDDADPGDGWGIRRAARLMFPDPAELAHDAAHTARLGVYLSDLLRPYGIELEAGALDRGGGQSYGEMAEAVIAMAVGPGETVDLLVLAYAIPDIAPGRATATYLSHVCPGNPLAFAICDQGTAAAFTGLRLIHEYARTGGCRRALLVVVEQAELLYEAGVPVERPAAHAAVALLFGDTAGDPSAPARLGPVRNHPDVDMDGTRAVLAAEVSALRAGQADVTVVLGSPLAKQAIELSDTEVRIAADGQPYTGVWWELAEAIGAEGSHRRVVIADYDAQLRYLSTAAIDLDFTVSEPVG